LVFGARKEFHELTPFREQDPWLRRFKPNESPVELLLLQNADYCH